MDSLTGLVGRRDRHGAVRLSWFFCSVLLAALALSVVSASANVLPPALWQTGELGGGAGQANFPRGVAADSTNGHVFVGDQNNRRVDEFTAWGRFVKAWGWDVVQSGPGDDTVAPVNEFEICVPAEGDVCQAGSSGSGTGQFNGAHGVAVDGSGNVYVVDRNNRRVQKFSSAGEFLSMFGGKVNKTKVEAAAPEAQQNRCPVDPGDVCQTGINGGGNGQFAGWAVGALVAIDPADNVYVGDQERIQRFDADGVYQGQIEVPGENVRSLAADTAGDLYVLYEQGVASKPDVHKLTPGGSPGTPASFPVASPTALTVDSEGTLYVFDAAAAQPVLAFAPDGEALGSFGQGTLTESTGMATNLCPGSDAPGNLFVVNVRNPTSINAYGTPPLGCEDPPLEPPQVAVQYALSVGAKEAQLGADINPEFFADTSYFVEYGTGACATGGCPGRAPLEGEAALESGVINNPLPAKSVFLEDLIPERTYHYRFVATSSGGGPEYGLRPEGAGSGGASFAAGLEGTFVTPPAAPTPKIDCTNQAFRGGPGSFLPDCRGFEMVSPIDKGGAGIETAWVGSNPLAHGTLDQSSGDGEGLAYGSKQAFGDAVGSPFSSEYVAERDPSEGWYSHSLNAPREGFPGLDRQALDTEFKAFTEDLSQGWLIHEGEPPLGACAPADSPNLYWRDSFEDFYKALHCEPNAPENGPNTVELQGVSADGCQAVFRSTSKLTADAKAAGTWQLYESNCSGPDHPEGPLRLVGVRPNGTACGGESSAGTAPHASGDLDNGRSKSVYGALSTDGKRLYWECAGTLYLRSDPDPSSEGESGEETVEIAAPSAGVAPRFQAASPDGSRALITTYDGPSGIFSLQAYDVEEGSLTPIAPVFKDSVGLQVDLLGASEDATRAYFVSSQVLGGGGANSEGEEAIAGQPNLYLHEAGAEPVFVGTLSGGDLTKDLRLLSPVHPLRFRRAARVSPDGLHAAFISSAPLTGYDNTDVNNGEADAEVFLYDAEPGGTGQLRCVSCNPSGQRPVGRNIAQTGEGIWAAAWIPGWQTQLYPGRPLSESGDRLFFNSIDALVPRDSNKLQDVYQWERSPSKAHCVEELGGELHVPASGGCLSLISSGQDGQDSEFVDADKDGSDVFIRTGESLVEGDPGLLDIYDARIGGGFPPPPAPKAPCEGEACQSPPPPPAYESPSSSQYKGPANARALPGAARCNRVARRATGLARRARGLAGKAKRADDPRGAKRMQKRARRLGSRAKGQRNRARRCRARARAKGRAGQ